MNRLFSYITLFAIFLAQLSPFIAFAQAADTALKDFTITVPSQVIVNEAFDMTVEAIDAAGKTFGKYEGTIFFDTNSNPSDVTLPFKDELYQFTLSDQGKRTFSK